MFDIILQCLIQSKTAILPQGGSCRQTCSLFINHGIFIFNMIKVLKWLATLFYLHIAVCVWSSIWFCKPTFVCHMYLILSTVKLSLKQILVVAIFCLDKWCPIQYDMVICNYQYIC